MYDAYTDLKIQSKNESVLNEARVSSSPSESDRLDIKMVM